MSIMPDQVFKSSTPPKRRVAEHAWRGLLACLIVLTVWASGLAQDTPVLSEHAMVSVITIPPGSPLYSSFGHTAIRVRDDSAGIDVGYNYGTFDFDDTGFYLKFLQGKLDYVLARNRFLRVPTGKTTDY